MSAGEVPRCDPSLRTSSKTLFRATVSWKRPYGRSVCESGADTASPIPIVCPTGQSDIERRRRSCPPQAPPASSQLAPSSAHHYPPKRDGVLHALVMNGRAR